MGKRGKRWIAVMLTAVMMAGALSGCGGGKKDDPNTLTLTLGSKDMDAFLVALQEEFPDIHFEIYQYAGINTTDFLRHTLIHNQPSDIFFHTQKAMDNLAQENLLDLSGYAFLNNIDQAMLNQFDVDGHIYQIPGPVSVRSVAYNKTMFEEHGWQKPNNHKELVELVKQIREEEPDLIPIAMSLGGVGYPFTCITTYSQAGFLSTPEGAAWEEKYLAGEASIEEGWSEGFAIMTDLINAGAFVGDEQFVGVWDYSVITDCFGQGNAAMVYVLGGQTAVANLVESAAEYEFALMPFYGLEEGNEVLGVNVSSAWGIGKHLGEKGNEKKLENALRVMEWISTTEGQTLLTGSNTEIPSLRDSSMDSVADFYKDLWEVAVNGHKATMVYAGYEDVLIEAGTMVQEYMLSGDATGMEEAVVKLVDETHAKALSNTEETVNYGTITEDLNHEQTVQLMANVIDSAGLADFTLITEGGRKEGSANKYGVSGWLYAGTVDNTNFNHAIPGDNHTVTVLTLTGAQVKTLLEEGRFLESSAEDGTGHMWDYYWSGIEVSMKDGKVKSAKLNGTELADDAVYKVAFNNGDYTEEIASAGNPEDTGVDLIDLYIDYLSQNSPVAAPEVLRK